MQLELHSPTGSESLFYTWPLTLDPDNSEHELVKTIRLVCKDVPELAKLDESLLCTYDIKSYKKMKALCGMFNQAVDGIASKNGASIVPERPSRELLRHILQQVYYRAVSDAEQLNHYKPFSSEVYGETSYDLICQLIDRIEITSDDIFIDLGSGVGQVVLQVAAATCCKICFGVEKAKVPSHYAEAMNKHFRAMMLWYGKKYGEYELLKGDFLLENHRQKIISATIIFVNNFAFESVLDHRLKQLFAELKDGTRIISSNSFSPLNFRISNRNLSDIGTIMHVSELPALRDSVSWTGTAVSYYLHIIDRTKLENYFQQLKHSKNTCKKGEHDKNSSNSNTQSSCDDQDSNYDFVTHWTSPDCSNKSKNNQPQEKVANQQSKHQLKKVHHKICQSRGAQHQKLVATANNTIEEIKRKKSSSDIVCNEINTGEVGQSVPYALQTLLATFRNQYVMICNHMKKPVFKNNISRQIQQETEYNQSLKFFRDEFENHIVALLDDNKTLAITRMSELGIPYESLAELATAAKQTLHHHKKLQAEASTLQIEVTKLEHDVHVKQQQREIAEKYGTTDADYKLLPGIIQELHHHKKLHAETSKLQIEVTKLEKEHDVHVKQQQWEIAVKYGITDAVYELLPGIIQEYILGEISAENVQQEQLPCIIQEYILKEISSTLANRRKLQYQICNLASELLFLQNQMTKESRPKQL